MVPALVYVFWIMEKNLLIKGLIRVHTVDDAYSIVKYCGTVGDQ